MAQDKYVLYYPESYPSARIASGHLCYAEHVMIFKVDVHGENIAFFIVSYDFPSFFLPFFLLSIGSKI